MPAPTPYRPRLNSECLVLVSAGVLLLAEFEGLAALDGELALGLALLALKTQGDLLCGLRLLVEHGLSLATVAHLLAVVTALALGEVRGLTSLVLSHTVNSVFLAFLALAESAALFGNVDLW